MDVKRQAARESDDAETDGMAWHGMVWQRDKKTS